jgi:hypothetical protein
MILLGGVTFGEDGFLVLSLWCLVRFCVTGLFFFVIILFYVCIGIIIRAG